MKEKINAEVILSLNKAGEEPKQVEFSTDKVSLLTIDNKTIVLNIVNEDGVSISIKFAK